MDKSKPTNSPSGAASRWRKITDDQDYESPYEGNREYARKYNLSNTKLFILDMIEDWILRLRDLGKEDQAEQVFQFKLELINELEHEFQLKGPL